MTITVMLIAEHDQRAGHYDLQSVWHVTRVCVMRAQLVQSHDLGDNKNSWSCRWLVMPERIRWYLHKTLFKTAKYTPSCLRSVITIIITMVLLLSPANPKTLIYYWLLLLSVTSLCTAEEQSDQPRIPLHFLHLVKRVEGQPPFSGWPSRATGQSHLQEYNPCVRACVCTCIHVFMWLFVCAFEHRMDGRHKRDLSSPLWPWALCDQPEVRVFFERGKDGTLPRLSPTA